MRKLGAWSQLTTQKARRVRQAWQTGSRGTGTASRYCDVKSLSRFPPFRSRDLLWPLSVWLFKQSPYPDAFFPHGALPGLAARGVLRLAARPSLWPSACCLLACPLKAVCLTICYQAPGCLCYTGIQSLCSRVNVPGDIAVLECLPQASSGESCTVWPDWEILWEFQA